MDKFEKKILKLLAELKEIKKEQMKLLSAYRNSVDKKKIEKVREIIDLTER